MVSSTGQSNTPGRWLLDRPPMHGRQTSLKGAESTPSFHRQFAFAFCSQIGKNLDFGTVLVSLPGQAGRQPGRGRVMGEVFASAPFVVGKSEPSPTDSHIP